MADLRRTRKIASLATPIALSMGAQVAMALISVIMVGRLGDAALASVGVGAAVFTMLLGALYGLETAVQAMVARRTGGDGVGLRAAMGEILGDAAPFAIAGALVMAGGVCLAAPSIIALASKDPQVIRDGVGYLYGVSPMILIMGLNVLFSGCWNGAGMPKYSFLASVVQAPCDVLFNYLLIFGPFGFPRMETAGAGLAATLSGLTALCVHLVVARKAIGFENLFRRLPDLSRVRTIIAIGGPVSVQQVTAYLGSYALLLIVGQAGVQSLAIANVLIVLMLVPMILATAMGIAGAILVGQALGQGDAVDARRWGWDAGRVGGLAILALSVSAILFPEAILGGYIHNPHTVAMGVLPLRLVAIGICFDAVGRILAYASRGAGATGLVTMVSLACQWGVLLPLAWLAAGPLGFGLVGVSAAQMVVFALESALMIFLWTRGGWSRSSVLARAGAA
ncbi:MAG TPA: MATE family efflux transporter [Phenylobacterium sp.]|jgi:putative MATE family efflux protein|uniref:MATE family efflux transporter n=1 Tax=Phenylobacterium sp. TaxID=1871053 RepID=UPI002D511094|nr:MATE family efflux transporter [Phenylobacterium sp.]HZZ67927.1 MATE family efflux transporter [Phenylobacterium sp.]